jgi:hypothetical protein|tara:strand:- start:180 stop:848 length:669 start_codon:yes stop_codon:yes gene_type:complete
MQHDELHKRLNNPILMRYSDNKGLKSMNNLSKVLTVISIFVASVIPATSMAASSQAGIGFENTSGAIYINDTRYTSGGTGMHINANMAISNNLGLMLKYRAADLDTSTDVKYTDLGIRYHLNDTTSTYFSANKASVAGNSESLMMLGAMHHMRLSETSMLSLKLGTSTSNLFDDLEAGFDFSIPVMDALSLNIGYLSKTTTLGKTNTKATSSGFSVGISSAF